MKGGKYKMARLTMDEIKKIIADICKEEFESSSCGKYYMARNMKESDVLKIIFDKLPLDMRKMIYINMSVYVFPCNENVLILEM